MEIHYGAEPVCSFKIKETYSKQTYANCISVVQQGHVTQNERLTQKRSPMASLLVQFENTGTWKWPKCRLVVIRNGKWSRNYRYLYASHLPLILNGSANQRRPGTHEPWWYPRAGCCWQGEQRESAVACEVSYFVSANRPVQSRGILFFFFF